MAVSHLVTLGHKKIAFLNGSLYSLVADSAQYHVPAFLEEGATAIICGNDLLAQGAISKTLLRPALVERESTARI